MVALLTWVLQDGVAMTGRIVFTAHFAPDLDMNCKTWRFAADIFNDLGMAFSLLAPWTGCYKTLIICLAGLLRALCGVCGGATRSALTQVKYYFLSDYLFSAFCKRA
jgi:hypothetical protein